MDYLSLLAKGNESLDAGDYPEAKRCFSELMYMHEDIPFSQYPHILENLHLTLTMEMLDYFIKRHTQVAAAIHDYLIHSPSFREHMSSPDFEKIEAMLNADSI
jgi:hypothetical protein